MKAKLYDKSGKEKSSIDLPEVFNKKPRADLCIKYYESQKMLDMQEYSSYQEAGKRHSASGQMSMKRHDWKGHYGKGISRVPRKTMWRRGVQFHWVGAETSGTRGGRRSHPPKVGFSYRKINKKEIKLAMDSAIAATQNKDFILARYPNLKTDSFSKVIESLPEKTKDLISALKNIFAENYDYVLRKKKVRSGKGKSRNRKYKSNAGLLIIKGKEEKVKSTGVAIKDKDSLRMKDLYPLGRLTLFTKKALEDFK